LPGRLVTGTWLCSSPTTPMRFGERLGHSREQKPMIASWPRTTHP